MIRPQTRSTLSDPLVPYTTRVRSQARVLRAPRRRAPPHGRGRLARRPFDVCVPSQREVQPGAQLRRSPVRELSLADSDRQQSAGRPAQLGRQLYRFLTRTDVLAAVTIAILCAAFLLETRAHRNLFYLAALPVYLLRLPTFDSRSLPALLIAPLASPYLGS